MQQPKTTAHEHYAQWTGHSNTGKINGAHLCTSRKGLANALKHVGQPPCSQQPRSTLEASSNTFHKTKIYTSALRPAEL